MAKAKMIVSFETLRAMLLRGLEAEIIAAHCEEQSGRIILTVFGPAVPEDAEIVRAVTNQETWLVADARR